MEEDENESDEVDENEYVSDGTECYDTCNDPDNNAADRIQWFDELCKNYEHDVHLNKVDPSDFAVVEKTYSLPVARYLKSFNVGLRKTKTGAFMIESPGSFATCVDLLLKGREEEGFNDKFRKHQKKPKITCKLDSKTPVQPGKSSSRNRKLRLAVTPKTCRQKLNIATFLTINSQIPEDDREYYKPPAEAFNFSEVKSDRYKCGLEAKDLYKLAMKTPIGNEDLVNHWDSSQQIQTILAQMQRQHFRFGYLDELNNVLKNEKGEDSKDALIVTLRQFLAFVHNVFGRVIPRSLFGSNKNVKVLRKVLKAYYLSPFESPINLEQCIDSLDISSISWLGAYKEPSLKWTVLAKITVWVFDRYFFRMFRAVFLEINNLNSGKRIMLSRKRWSRFQSDYIQSKIRLGGIVKCCHGEMYRLNHTPRVTMGFFPKSTGARRIHKSEIELEHVRDIEVLEIFLKQLYLNKYDVTNLDSLYLAWRAFAKENGENANKKVNVVTCDVSDAFGSILQEKLMEILTKMIAEIPEELLILQWYEIQRPGTKKRQPIIEYRQWFSCFLEPPAVKPRSLIAPSIREHHKREYVMKDYILARLRSFVLEQSWWYRDQEYSVLYGVSQGTKLSSSLSDIYYQHMMAEEFGIFMKSGTLLRYVDDFIYMTRHEASAKRFLRVVRRGIPEYNCHFGRQKVQANFQSRSCKESEWVVYLGYKLNGATMEVRPVYEKQGLQYSYAILRQLRESKLPNFALFMKRNLGLKLHPIVLDPKLNDVTGVCATVGLVAEKQARRCMFLLTTIFTSYKVVVQSERVMLEIRAVVKPLERLFCRQLTARDRARWPDFRKNISLAIWLSFYRTFATDRRLREIYCKEIRAMALNRTVL